MTCPMMMSLGVYVLGAADTGERQRLEAHLPACEACRAELTRLAPLPGLLAGIPEEMRGTATTPGHRVGRWAAAATACLAAAACAAGGFWLSSGAGQHAHVLTLSGANPATRVSATASLTATSWGTSIQLRVSGLPENVDCRLVVRSLAGKTEVSGVWDAWQRGPVSIPASASWLPSDIASLSLATPAHTLLTISAHPAAHQAGQS